MQNGQLFNGAAGVIKSIQRGTIAITGATSNTAAITAVDPANSILRYLGHTFNTGDASDKDTPLLTFTSGTVITASVTTSPGAQTTTVSFEVIEFYPGFIKSIQRGTITSAAGTAAITAVDITKTELHYLGSLSTNGAITNMSAVRISLTSNVLVTATFSTSLTGSVGYQVVEYY